jgi:hypothetical protein
MGIAIGLGDSLYGTERWSPRVIVPAGRADNIHAHVMIL